MQFYWWRRCWQRRQGCGGGGAASVQAVPKPRCSLVWLLIVHTAPHWLLVPGGMEATASPCIDTVPGCVTCYQSYMVDWARLHRTIWSRHPFACAGSVSVLSGACSMQAAATAERTAEEGTRLLAEAASSSGGGRVRESQLAAMPPANPLAAQLSADVADAEALAGDAAGNGSGLANGSSSSRAAVAPHQHGGSQLAVTAAGSGASLGSPSPGGGGGRGMSLARAPPASPASVRSTPRGTPASTPRKDRA